MKDISLMVGDYKLNYRVALLIEKDGAVLVEVNPSIDFVTIPGGRVKTGESSLDAVKREMQEEMGITLKDNDVKMHAILENFFEFENTKFHELYIMYKLENLDFDLENNMKNIDSVDSYYKWVSYEELKNIKILPAEVRETVNRKDFTNYIVR